MRILLDADTLLEFLLNRSKFIGKVEYLAEIFGANSSIQLYLSKPGLDKIVSLQALNEKESEQLVTGLRKRIKILRVTKTVAKKAKSSSAIDCESAVEIQLAIKANIGAIVTHKPSDFSSEELSIITLSDLPQRNHLEVNLSKNIKDLPAVLVINSEQISNLDKAFYHLPSYTGVEPLKPKESSHLLDLTRSSEKVSSPSGDNSSPRSTNARSRGQIIADGLLNQSAFDRLTARADLIKSDSLATGYRAYTSHIASLNESILQSGKAYSFITDSLSRQIYKSPFDNLRESMLQVSKPYSLLTESLSYQSKFLRSSGQFDAPKITIRDLADAGRAYINPLDNLTESILKANKPYSFLGGNLSHKSELLRAISRTDKKRMDDERSFFANEKKRLDDEREKFFANEKKRLDDERRFYSKQSNQLFN